MRGSSCGKLGARVLPAAVVAEYGPPATYSREYAILGAETTSPAPMLSRMLQPATMRVGSVGVNWLSSSDTDLRLLPKAPA